MFKKYLYSDVQVVYRGKEGVDTLHE